MNADWVMPVLIVGLLSAGAWKRLPMYDLFVQGAREGLKTAVQVLPNLAAILRAHSLAEAMLTAALTLFRLIRSQHLSHLLKVSIILARGSILPQPRTDYYIT